MELVEQCRVELDRCDLFARVPIARTPVKRSPGVHLSGVLRYIAERIGRFEAIKEIDQERVPILWCLGHMWEEFGVSLYPNVLWQPGEVRHRGVIMSIDGIDPVAQEIHEWKFTFKKVRTDARFLDEWYWMSQAKGYECGWDLTRHVFHVLYVMGDYRGSGPQYWRYRTTTTSDELERTWRMVEAHIQGAIPE
jgi:hypothetical protein